MIVQRTILAALMATLLTPVAAHALQPLNFQQQVNNSPRVHIEIPTVKPVSSVALAKAVKKSRGVATHQRFVSEFDTRQPTIPGDPD